jgi:hypothetical protein
MSTPDPHRAFKDALASLPAEFRDRLVKRYVDLRAAYSEGSFDACALRVARFSEIVLRFLQQQLSGQHIAFGDRIGNFNDECAKLERLPASTGEESLRIIIPRALSFAYTLRNKRGISHEGGDVEANEIDAAASVRLADWVMCELIRLFHSLSLEEAQSLIDAIAVRQVPEIWYVGGKKRILHDKLDYKSQVLMLLQSQRDGTALTEDLFEWTEHPRLADFKKDILRPLHRDRHVEYDSESETVEISPKGVKRVEREILPKLRAIAAA